MTTYDVLKLQQALATGRRGLSPEVKAQAEAKACEEPQWAYWLRCNVPDLSPKAKARAKAA